MVVFPTVARLANLRAGDHVRKDMYGSADDFFGALGMFLSSYVTSLFCIKKNCQGNPEKGKMVLEPYTNARTSGPDVAPSRDGWLKLKCDGS